MLAVYVSAVAVDEVLSVPLGLVPCQYHDAPPDGDPTLLIVVGAQFDAACGVEGAAGIGLTNT